MHYYLSKIEENDEKEKSEIEDQDEEKTDEMEESGDDVSDSDNDISSDADSTEEALDRYDKERTMIHVTFPLCLI